MTRSILLGICISIASIAWADSVKRVTQAEAIGAATTKVNPEYPAIARQLKLTGSVELDVTIAESGVVENVNIINGNPVLTRPAADALKKWKFKPFTEGGAPVKASVVFSFIFKP